MHMFKFHFGKENFLNFMAISLILVTSCAWHFLSVKIAKTTFVRTITWKQNKLSWKYYINASTVKIDFSRRSNCETKKLCNDTLGKNRFENLKLILQNKNEMATKYNDNWQTKNIQLNCYQQGKEHKKILKLFAKINCQTVDQKQFSNRINER